MTSICSRTLSLKEVVIKYLKGVMPSFLCFSWPYMSLPQGNKTMYGSKNNQKIANHHLRLCIKETDLLLLIRIKQKEIKNWHLGPTRFQESYKYLTTGLHSYSSFTKQVFCKWELQLKWYPTHLNLYKIQPKSTQICWFQNMCSFQVTLHDPGVTSKSWSFCLSREYFTHSGSSKISLLNLKVIHEKTLSIQDWEHRESKVSLWMNEGFNPGVLVRALYLSAISQCFPC